MGETSTEPQGKLTIQQQLVLERYHKLLDFSIQNGRQLDGKASTMLQAGSIITGLTGIVAIPQFIQAPTSLFHILVVAIGFAVFLGMLICAILAWMPSSLALPGTINKKEIIEHLLDVEVSMCYNQILSDVIAAVSEVNDRNRQKAKLVKFSTWLLAAQIIGIILIAVLTAANVLT